MTSLPFSAPLFHQIWDPAVGLSVCVRCVREAEVTDKGNASAIDGELSRARVTLDRAVAEVETKITLGLRRKLLITCDCLWHGKMKWSAVAGTEWGAEVN